MDEPIDDLYFKWLSAKVLSLDHSIYGGLLLVLYKTEFVWVIKGDQNRAEDGCELRNHFLRETSARCDQVWFNQPCSVLEMFIAFSHRASFQTDTPSRDWFWKIIENLQLDEFRQVGASDLPIIEDILYGFLWRLYDDSGHGGMFPLRWPKCDQREVEIWYQFFDYLEDQGLV